VGGFFDDEPIAPSFTGAKAGSEGTGSGDVITFTPSVFTASSSTTSATSTSEGLPSKASCVSPSGLSNLVPS